MALNGFSDEAIKEAAWVVQSVTGASSYVHGVDYPREKFVGELDRMIAHIKSKQA